MLLSYLFVILLPVALIGYFLVTGTTQTFIKQTDEINKISFQQIENNINNKLAGYIKISDSILSDNQLMKDLQEDYASDSDYMDRYLSYIRYYPSKFLTDNPDNIQVRILTTNKTVFSDENFVFKVDEQMKKEKWYMDILNSRGMNTIREPYLNNNKMVFSIGRLLNPFTAKNHTNVLVIEIPENELYNLIEKEGANKEIDIIDNNGFIVTSTNRDYVGRNCSGIPYIREIVGNNEAVNSKSKNSMDLILVERLNSNNSFRNWKIVSIFSSKPILKDINEIVRYSFVICSIVILFSIMSIYFFSNKLTKRLRKLVHNMGKIKDGRFDVFVNYKAKDEIGELSRSFKDMIDRINNLINEVYLYEMRVKDLQIKKKEAELNALQSQINPHFLFNTMESICMNLIKKGDIEISDVIQSFTRLLRKSIDWGSGYLTLRKELDLSEHYLKIQKFRYRDKFEYKIEVNSELYEIIIPKFIIQPIVENAIYHGIEMKEAQGMLKIFSQITENNIMIVVEDDGVGMDNDKLMEVINGLDDVQNDEEKNGRIGIKNVHQRLKLYYGQQYGVLLESEKNSGTRVRILLPNHIREGGIQNV